MNQSKHKNPYPGLRPFHQDEEKFFFGRDEHIKELIHRLERYQFVSVIGQSGCGKSSLISAGLIPTLKKQSLERSGKKWLITQLRPETSPIHNLAQAIFSTYQYNKIEICETQLVKSDLKIATGIINLLRTYPLPQHTNLLLFIDQFEEIFRYRQQYDADEAVKFVNLLIESSKQEEFPVYIVITMRTSFLGDCSSFYGLPEILNKCLFITPRLTREQLKSVIEEPALIRNVNVDAKLVNRLINEMERPPKNDDNDKEHELINQKEHDQSQLAILQHFLMRIWNSKNKHQLLDLCFSDYEEMGNFSQALSEHADEAFLELNPEQQIIAEKLFCCLCERAPNNTVTRRPVKISAVVKITQFDQEKLRPVIEVFSKAGREFITVSDNEITEDSILDISHESLIRNWTRLSEWVEKEYALAEQYKRIDNTARLWKKGDAALLTGIDLEFALKWKQEDKSKDWALQYGSHYDDVIELLEESEKQKQFDLKNQEKKTRNKIIMKSMMIAVIIASFFAIWGFNERRNALKTLFESKLTHAALNAQIGNYYNANTLLNQTHNISGISNERITVRNLISWYVNLMCSTPEKTYHLPKPIKDFSISSDGNNFVYMRNDANIQNCIFHNEKSRPVIERSTNSVSKIYCHNNGFISVGDYITIQDFSGKPLVRKLIRNNSSSYLLNSLPQEVETKEIPLFISMDVSSDEKRIAIGSENITIYSIYKSNANTFSLKELDTFLAVSISCLAFSPTGKFLASGLDDGQIIIWNIETGEQNRMFKENSDSIVDLSFHPKSNILASVDSADRLIIWDIFSGRPIKIDFSSKISDIKNIRFDQSGNYIFVAGLDRNILLIDVNSGVTINEFQGHNAGISAIQIRGENLYSASLDCSIKKWNIYTDKYFSIYTIDINKNRIERQKIIDHITDPIELTSSDISSEGQYIAYGFTVSSTKKNGIGLYNLNDKSEVWKKEDVHSNKINHVIFSNNEAFLSSASHDNTVQIREKMTGSLVKEIKENDTESIKAKGISGCVFTPDSHFIISSHYNGRIGVFGIRNNTEKYYHSHEGGVNSIFWNSSGNKLFSVSDDGKIIIWDWKAHPEHLLKKNKEYQLSINTIRWATISPDDTKIAFMGEDQKIHIVKNLFETPPFIYDLSGHERDVISAAFTPNSNQLISISKDSTIRFWDLFEDSGIELINLRLPIKSYYHTALWDFNFSCFPSEQSKSHKRCIITAPLSDGNFAMYTMDNVY